MPGAMPVTNLAPQKLQTEQCNTTMSDIRSYLVERFRSDAATLRQRSDGLSSVSGTVVGPDAALSRHMADACDEVAGLAELLPADCSVTDILVALQHLLPELARRAADPALSAAPAVRSVYAGAATRVQELIAAESRLSGEVSPDDFEDQEGDIE